MSGVRARNGQWNAQARSIITKYKQERQEKTNKTPPRLIPLIAAGKQTSTIPHHIAIPYCNAMFQYHVSVTHYSTIYLGAIRQNERNRVEESAGPERETRDERQKTREGKRERGGGGRVR